MTDSNQPQNDNGKYKLYSDSPTYTISLSYMKYFWRFILMSLVIYKLVDLYFQVPVKGMRVFEVLGMSNINPSSPMFWKKILVYKLSQEYFQYPLLALIAASLLLILYWILVCKFTIVSINFKFIEYRHGIFVRKIDSIDLITVKDQNCSFSWHDRMLGISNLEIDSTDKSHPHLKLSGLKYSEGFDMMNYVRENNYQNYTDYRIDKDKSVSKNPNKRKSSDEEYIGTDGDDN